MQEFGYGLTQFSGSGSCQSPKAAVRHSVPVSASLWAVIGSTHPMSMQQHVGIGHKQLKALFRLSCQTVVNQKLAR